jgi:predicted 3-demethylubiquinone-9 3-methyltransferase (glyoxalase superfamily)
MSVTFKLDGQEYVALNDGTYFQFADGRSLAVDCQAQDEVDTYWDKLGAGGEEGPCGWPQRQVGPLVAGQPHRRLRAAISATPIPRERTRHGGPVKMKKIDIKALEDAYAASPLHRKKGDFSQGN